MSLLSQKFKFLRKKDVSPSGHQITEEGGREWENFYRDRWSYDKVVRTTHGVTVLVLVAGTFTLKMAS